MFKRTCKSCIFEGHPGNTRQVSVSNQLNDITVNSIMRAIIIIFLMFIKIILSFLGWFQGLSQKFLACDVPKMLLLAGWSYVLLLGPFLFYCWYFDYLFLIKGMKMHSKFMLLPCWNFLSPDPHPDFWSVLKGQGLWLVCINIKLIF